MHTEDDDLIWREVHFPDEKQPYTQQPRNGSPMDSAREFMPRDEEDTQSKIREVDANLWGTLARAGKKISFKRDVVALYRYMKDSDILWYRKGIVIMALLYFIMPIDVIPDITPVLGYLDDLGVIAATIRYLGNELTPYYE